MRVLVTGVTGFVGSTLFRQLASSAGYIPVAGVRAITSGALQLLEGLPIAEQRWVELGNLAEAAIESDPLVGVEAVVHCAGRTHIMNDKASDRLAEFRAVNLDGTLKLARAAVDAGVRRFIFLSTVKVHGESTLSGRQFSADSPLRPDDPYAISKLEAEHALSGLAAETGLEVVTIRPPLVYGAGAKGNFASLIKLVERGLPLPFGAIHNKRSLIGVHNLVDLIVQCLEHPAAVNQAFLASDDQDVSTTELFMQAARQMGKPARLIPIPAGALRLGAALLGKRAMAHRMLDSLQVDIGKTRRLLGWAPRYSFEEEMGGCFEPPVLPLAAR